MSERTVRVQLCGGPRDGWVYDVALHWELAPGARDIEWVPPSRIQLQGWPEPGQSPGAYLQNGLEENGNLLYDWVAAPAPAAADALQEALGG